MKKLESGQDQLQRICDLLRHDTLEPALAEARRIENEAQQNAKRLIEDAHRKASEREAAAHEQIKKEREIFDQNLRQALKQAADMLKQEILHSLFNSSLAALLQRPLSEPHLMAKLVDAIVEAIQKEGIDSSLELEVGKQIPAQQLVQALQPAVKEELQKGRILTASFPSGIAIKISDKDVTLDMSESAIRDWLGRFLRKDFRDMLFG
jgi:V/A-type H+-transporting ATPase subunit E